MTSELLVGGFLLAISVFVLLNGFSAKQFELKFTEGFQELAATLSTDEPVEMPLPELAAETQCGIGYDPCAEGQKCMNGYCKSTKKPTLKKTELPVIP